MIREIGTAAREELEARLGVKVWLGLRVKVSPRWRDDVRVLSAMEPGVAVLEEDLEDLMPPAGEEDAP
jgi:hypothetical protein